MTSRKKIVPAAAPILPTPEGVIVVEPAPLEQVSSPSPKLADVIAAANAANSHNADAPPPRTYKLNERVMQAHIEVSVWSGTRTNREVSDEIAELKGADKRAGKYLENIVDRAALERIGSIAGQARLRHYSLTFPGLASRGPRLLAVDGWFNHVNEMNAFKKDFEVEVERFIARLPEIKEMSRISLGEMFKDEMFPTSDEVRGRFGFNTRYLQLPESSNWILDLDEENVNALRKDAQAQLANILSDAIRSTYERVLMAVQNAAEKLREYEPHGGRGKGFRNSLLENMRDLAKILPGLNFSQDPRIAELTTDINNAFGLVDARSLRDSDTARNKIADTADEIARKVSGWLVMETAAAA